MPILPIPDTDLAKVEQWLVPMLVHQDGVVVFVNAAGYRALQFDPDRFDFTGVAVSHLFHPADRPLILRQAAASQRSAPSPCHYSRRMLDGYGQSVIVWIRATLVLWQDRNAFAEALVVDTDSSNADPEPQTCLHILTTREREVARLMWMGFTAARAANVLGVGTATVRSHIKSIYRKLRLGNRTELVRRFLHAFPS